MQKTETMKSRERRRDEAARASQRRNGTQAADMMRGPQAPTAQAAGRPAAKQPPPEPDVSTFDEVDEASYESFPASDPPAFSSRRSNTPGSKR
jgi:hypothetical protein